MSQGEMVLTPEDAALLLMLIRPESMSFWVPSADLKQWEGLRQKLEACAALVPPPLNGDLVSFGLTTGLLDNGRPQNQSETIVRARSMAQAVRLLGKAGEHVSTYRFRNYWTVTGNRVQLVVAKEEGVWVNPYRWSDNPEGWIKK